jgi:hypothetical protein
MAQHWKDVNFFRLFVVIALSFLASMMFNLDDGDMSYWVHLCEEGTPDRITMVRGQTIFIETKTFGKKPTPEQLKKHSELRQSGAVVIVADNFQTFKQQFEAIRAAIEARKGEIHGLET